MKRRPTVPDEALWHAVARTVEPLARAKKRVAEKGQTQGSDPTPDPIKRSENRPAAPDGHKPAPIEVAVRPKRPAPQQPPPLAAFERRKARRIASGTIDIEARIDLHGLRQSDAHHRLTGFIRDCAARGLATVLVITGKGGRRESVSHRVPGPLRHPWDEPWGDLDARDHGVLRRSVPMWLAEPEMRAFIVSYTVAGPRHGGTGALYVHLRRRMRVRGE